MNLDDLKLKFARPLIEHWLSIRQSNEKVPWEHNLRPTEIMKVLDISQIMDISTPEKTFIAVIGKRIGSRYETMPSQPRNWFTVLPPEAVKHAKEAIRHVVHDPAGFWCHYQLHDLGETEEGQFVALPLMTAKNILHPTVWITLTNVKGEGKLTSPPVSSFTDVQTEYIDLKR